jgi:hypothetical protein
MKRLLLVLLVLLFSGCQWAAQERSVGLEGRAQEKTSHVRAFSWAGQSPGETLSKSGSIRVGRDGRVEFGEPQGVDIVSGVSKGTFILYLIGGLAIAGGLVVTLWMKNIKLGLSVAAAGAAMMAVAMLMETYPWIILIGALVAVGGVVWFILDARKNGRLSTALKAVVQGVQDAPAEAAEQVKASIGEAAKEVGAKTVVKEVVTATKDSL